ncbi:MAG: helix-turn-helix transcriptional regulator [Treponema sp.]|nr:helix-turn-helix transcriptional regulator [Treponema sp.]
MESKELRECLSLNLKKYRKVRNWSQFELSEKAEISEQTINSIEGLRLWPSDKTLIKIAKALDVEIYSLFIPQNLEVRSEIITELKESVLKTVENIVHEALQDWKR